MIDLKALEWERHEASFLSEKPYSEAILNALFQDLIDSVVFLHITIRKYPSRYFIAYEMDIDGSVPEYCDVPVHIFSKTWIPEFEESPDKYIQKLYDHLKSQIE